MRKARVRVPPRVRHARGGTQLGAGDEGAKQGEGNEKEEGDERNKGQFEKKSPCFCFSVREIEK